MIGGHGVRALVTGGAGYIGSVLVPMMLAAGHRVTVLDNFMFRQTSLNAVCWERNFEVVRGDARDESVVAPLLKSVDVVIPLAALVGAPLCDSNKLAAVTTNVGAIQLLAKLMSPHQMMLIPISNSGYGIGEPAKMCTEASLLRPVSLYGCTKVEAEKIAMGRGNAISFRFATLFGMSSRMRLDLLVNDFVHRACTDRAVVLFEGHFRRNFLHVRDAANAFLHGIENFDQMRNQIYNVGLSSANLTKIELCQRIQRHVPDFVYTEAPIGHDLDKRDYVVSNAKIEATGWAPAWSLDDGIAELVKSMKMIRNGVHGNV